MNHSSTNFSPLHSPTINRMNDAMTIFGVVITIRSKETSPRLELPPLPQRSPMKPSKLSHPSSSSHAQFAQIIFANWRIRYRNSIPQDRYRSPLADVLTTDNRHNKRHHYSLQHTHLSSRNLFLFGVEYVLDNNKRYFVLVAVKMPGAANNQNQEFSEAQNNKQQQKHSRSWRGIISFNGTIHLCKVIRFEPAC